MARRTKFPRVLSTTARCRSFLGFTTQVCLFFLYLLSRVKVYYSTLCLMIALNSLRDPTAYNYLNKEARTIQGTNDSSEFSSLRNSMTVVGLSETEQNDAFRLVSGVLWLKKFFH